MFPLTKYHFSVDWGGTRIGFTEVSGLEWEIQPIEYRDGNDPGYAMQKLPGINDVKSVKLEINKLITIYPLNLPVRFKSPH